MDIEARLFPTTELNHLIETFDIVVVLVYFHTAMTNKKVCDVAHKIQR